MTCLRAFWRKTLKFIMLSHQLESFGLVQSLVAHFYEHGNEFWIL
jgi:hypothetical protein